MKHIHMSIIEKVEYELKHRRPETVRVSNRIHGLVKWKKAELDELERINNTDSNYDLTWAMVADCLNKDFGNNRTAEACRKRYGRLLSI